MSKKKKIEDVRVSMDETYMKRYMKFNLCNTVHKMAFSSI